MAELAPRKHPHLGIGQLELVHIPPPGPRLFGEFSSAAAGELLPLPDPDTASARVRKLRDASAQYLTRQVWDTVWFARDAPDASTSLLACWVHDHGGTSMEVDYYCERLLEDSRDWPRWTRAQVNDFVSPAGAFGRRQLSKGITTLPDWKLAEALALAWRTQEDDHPDLPEPMARVLMAELLDASPVLEGGVLLVNISREAACAFVEAHHSALPYCNLRGMMYAIGAVVPDATGRPMLVAVATAGSPSGAWGAKSGCSQHGTLELTRVASVAGVKTVDRKGRVRPLGASSKLTSRMMDLLPLSGRGEPGCRFVTYSLGTEQATTYLALASKGLRPVAFKKGKLPSGARAKAAPENLGHLDKIVWQYGPGAAPPRWDLIDPRRRGGAERAFAQYLRRQP